MQVGDLVRVYHFSHTARRHYKARAGMTVETYVPDDIDGHVIGLIVENTDDANALTDTRGWRVLIPEWKQQEIFSEERIEVINESR